METEFAGRRIAFTEVNIGRVGLSGGGRILSARTNNCVASILIRNCLAIDEVPAQRKNEFWEQRNGSNSEKQYC